MRSSQAMDPTCQAVHLGQGASERLNMRALMKTLIHNYKLLFLSGVFIACAVFVLVVLAIMANRAIGDYYTYISAPPASSSTSSATAAILASANLDDEVYTPVLSTASPQREGGLDRSAIESRLAYLKKLYEKYNREMGSYARNVLNREPDNLFDRSILDTAKDTYKK